MPPGRHSPACPQTGLLLSHFPSESAALRLARTHHPRLAFALSLLGQASRGLCFNAIRASRMPERFRPVSLQMSPAFLVTGEPPHSGPSFASTFHTLGGPCAGAARPPCFGQLQPAHPTSRLSRAGLSRYVFVLQLPEDASRCHLLLRKVHSQLRAPSR